MFFRVDWAPEIEEVLEACSHFLLEQLAKPFAFNARRRSVLEFANPGQERIGDVMV